MRLTIACGRRAKRIFMCSMFSLTKSPGYTAAPVTLATASIRFTCCPTALGSAMSHLVTLMRCRSRLEVILDRPAFSAVLIFQFPPVQTAGRCWAASHLQHFAVRQRANDLRAGVCSVAEIHAADHDDIHAHGNRDWNIRRRRK